MPTLERSNHFNQADAVIATATIVPATKFRPIKAAIPIHGPRSRGCTLPKCTQTAAPSAASTGLQRRRPRPTQGLYRSMVGLRNRCASSETSHTPPRKTADQLETRGKPLRSYVRATARRQSADRDNSKEDGRKITEDSTLHRLFVVVGLVALEPSQKLPQDTRIAGLSYRTLGKQPPHRRIIIHCDVEVAGRGQIRVIDAKRSLLAELAPIRCQCCARNSSVRIAIVLRHKAKKPAHYP